MLLSLFHDAPESESAYKIFAKDHVLARLRAIDRMVSRKGPRALDPRTELIARIATSASRPGDNVDNALSPFHLRWHAEEHPDWSRQIAARIAHLKEMLKQQGTGRTRFLIWTAPSPQAEEMLLYADTGLLRRSPRTYCLNSPDPAQLRAVIDDIHHRGGASLSQSLKGAMVMAVSADRGSQEPCAQLNHIFALQKECGIAPGTNVFTLAPPQSALDRFAAEHKLNRLDASTELAFSGELSRGPLSLAHLYPLALCKVDMRPWIEGTFLNESQIHTAWRLAAFLDEQCKLGRKHITLVTPKPLCGVGPWTKQYLEQVGPGKNSRAIRVVIEDKIRVANYHSPKDSAQNRAFLAFRMKGIPAEKPDKASLLRRAGYPLASVTLPKDAAVSSYQQFIQFTAFGLAYLRESKLTRGKSSSGIVTAGQHVAAWKWDDPVTTARQWLYRSAVRFLTNSPALPETAQTDGPEAYAYLVKSLIARNAVDHAQLVYCGETRYTHWGRAFLKTLNRCSESFYRSRLNMPVSVCEWPGSATACQHRLSPDRKGLVTFVVPLPPAGRPAEEAALWEYRCQILPLEAYLSERKIPVALILLKNLREPTRAALEGFFRQSATALRHTRI